MTLITLLHYYTYTGAHQSSLSVLGGMEVVRASERTGDRGGSDDRTGNNGGNGGGGGATERHTDRQSPSTGVSLSSVNPDTNVNVLSSLQVSISKICDIKEALLYSAVVGYAIIDTTQSGSL